MPSDGFIIHRAPKRRLTHFHVDLYDIYGRKPVAHFLRMLSSFQANTSQAAPSASTVSHDEGEEHVEGNGDSYLNGMD